MENKLTTSLKGLNALVCGSTSGIGKSTAIEFSQLGASVTLFARNERKLNESLSLLQNNGNQTQNIPPTTSVNDKRVSSAAGIAFDPTEYKIKPKQTKVPCTAKRP